MRSLKVMASAVVIGVGAMLCTPAAFALNFSKNSSGSGTAAALLIFVLLAAMFTAMAVIVHQGRTGRINVPWAILAVVLTVMALFVSIIGYSYGTLYTKPDGNPKETVKAFFAAITAGEYENAYSYLGDYTGLGLENQPADENAALVYADMKNCFEYNITGEAEISKLNAYVPVRLRYLCIPDAESAVEEQINKNLKKFVEDNPRNKVYDADNRYLPELTDMLYTDALKYVIEHSGKYCRTEQMYIELAYDGGEWHILTNKQLLNALTGGMTQ